MTKANEAENILNKPIPSEKQREMCAAKLLFAAVTLGAALIVCAISGPKLPPYLGD